MTIASLRTPVAAQWMTTEETFGAALMEADHPLLDQHAATAARLLVDNGRPSRIWADRIAAIAIIAGRRADTAPTIQRRGAYLDVHDAACDLLQIAADVHGVQPRAEALSLLAPVRPSETLTESGALR